MALVFLILFIQILKEAEFLFFQTTTLKNTLVDPIS